MCRLYGQISLKPSAAYRELAESARSLLAQSHAKKGREQKDGWGLGRYDPKPRIVKSEKPVYQEAEKFKRAAREARSRILIAHIRAASNPRKLPIKRLISPENSQPFSYGNLLFAHNGTVNIPDKVFENLGAYRKRVKGLNDSEIYFWQLVKFLEKKGSIPEALEACVRELWSLKAEGQKPYYGLNALVSDGKSLYAFCHYPAPEDGPRALCTPSRPWGRMVFKKKPGRVLISSEPADSSGRWKDIQDGEFLSVGPRLEITRRKLCVSPT